MPLELLPAMLPRMRRESRWAVGDARAARARAARACSTQVARRHRGARSARGRGHRTPRSARPPQGHVVGLQPREVRARVPVLPRAESRVSRRGNFARTYDSLERAWGRARARRAGAHARCRAASCSLTTRSRAVGIGTPRDIADHFRLLAPKSLRPRRCCGRLPTRRSSAGSRQWVDVEGWREPALLAAGEPLTPLAGPDGRGPALSPFDPVCWYRPRLERMFGVEYRIEIYTPAPKRMYGYYCLPFLLGDQIVAPRRPQVRPQEPSGSSWPPRGERPRTRPGARRRPDADVAAALADGVGLAARVAGTRLIVVVKPRGDLAPTEPRR